MSEGDLGEGGLISLVADEDFLLFCNVGFDFTFSFILLLSALTLRDPSFTTRVISSAKAGGPLIGN